MNKRYKPKDPNYFIHFMEHNYQLVRDIGRVGLPKTTIYEMLNPDYDFFTGEPPFDLIEAWKVKVLKEEHIKVEDDGGSQFVLVNMPND